RARARSATAVPFYSSSGPSQRRRADNSSISGRFATNRSHPSNMSETWSTSGPTMAIPIEVRRCSRWFPTSETDSSNRLRSSAINGRTSERFCFNECTSPSNRSSSSTPTYIEITPVDPIPTGSPAGAAAYAAPADHSDPRLLAVLVRLDHVIDLDVVERAERDTTLVTVTDLDDIVLEPTKRPDLQVVRHDHTVTQHPCPRIPPELARPHDAARDRSRLGGLEHVADLGPAEIDCLVLRLEHALESLLDLLDRLVDHRVVTHIDTFTG